MGSGFFTSFESGFPAGTVGLGVDAHAFLDLKLNSGKGHSGTGLSAPKTIIPAVAVPLNGEFPAPTWCSVK
jgi:hypothetical protein